MHRTILPCTLRCLLLISCLAMRPALAADPVGYTVTLAPTGEAPLDAVDSIEIKRLLMGKVVKVVIRGSEFKLEAGAGANAKGVVDAFEQRRAAAV